MTDFPAIVDRLPSMTLCTAGDECPLSDDGLAVNAIYNAGAWPTANRAVYVPVLVDVPCTAYKMAFIVGAQAGNYDIGIYDQAGTRLVSTGSTAVPVAGIAIVDITDTTLSTPGIYYLAMVCSTVTTLTVFRNQPTDMGGRLSGMKTEDLGATTLPASWTAITTNATNFCPLITATLQVTI